MSKLAEKRKELEEINGKLEKVWEEVGDERDFSKAESLGGSTTAEKLVEFNKMHDALGDAVDAVKTLELVEGAKVLSDEADAMLKASAALGGRPLLSFDIGAKAEEVKSPADLILDNLSAVKGGSGMEFADFDAKMLTKADFATTAGWAPETTRTGRVVDFATFRPTVIDAVPQGETGQASVVYMEETAYTNPAAETAEGGAFNEATLVLTQRTTPTRKITVFLPITDEQLEDVPQARGYVNRRLPYMLRQRASTQILVGDGLGNNLEGLHNVTGVQTQAKAADPAPDAIHKAMTLVEVNGQALADLVFMHPTDWEGIRLLKTADGIYIWGSPSEAGPTRIWGRQVIVAQEETQGQALVGDSMFMEFAIRRGITLKISDSHADYFTNGKQAIRADMRAALPVYRPSAFCQVTGL